LAPWHAVRYCGLVDKEASREVRGNIRRVLMEVNDTPEAADEYDLYIGAVSSLIDLRRYFAKPS
jgi:hypothetical protein